VHRVTGPAPSSIPAQSWEPIVNPGPNTIRAQGHRPGTRHRWEGYLEYHALPWGSSASLTS
jgi:hypothetical protein